MRWPRDAATRMAERQEREVLERYLRLRTLTVSEAWVEAVGEASRRADAVLRLDRLLQHRP
jgi:hypothetical protein